MNAIADDLALFSAHGSLGERIRRRIDVSSGGCWFWRGTMNNGYGRVSVSGKYRYVHRVVFELLVGEIAEGLQIDHLCMVTICVNPAHLEAVTPRVNTLRSYAVPTRVASRRRNPCVSGHPRTPENVHIDPKSGKIHCRPCNAARQREYAARQAAKA